MPSLSQEFEKFDSLLLMPKASLSNPAQFTERYAGLSEQLTSLEVKHGFAFTHDSFKALHAGFANIRDIAMGEVALNGTSHLIRDLTMPKFTEPLYRTAAALDIAIIHHPELNKKIADKAAMYALAPSIFPITTIVHDSLELTNALDIVPGKTVVVKPATGMRSRGVQILPKTEANKLELQAGKWLVQEFIDNSGGIPEYNVQGVHNLRTIVIGGQPIGAIVRHAVEGDELLKNDYYGEAIAPDKLNVAVMGAIGEVVRSLASDDLQPDNAVLAMDFAYGRGATGGPDYYMIEVNRRPMRISSWTLGDDPRCTDGAGLLELARQWDHHEARMIKNNIGSKGL